MTSVPQAWKDRAAAAECNRAAMPVTARFLDDLRQHFPTAHVTFAAEAGHEVGQRGDEGVVATVVYQAEKKGRGA